MLKKFKSIFVILFLVFTIFSFTCNNFIFADSNVSYFDVNTTTFSALPSASDINVDSIKQLILSVNADLDLTDFNTLVTSCYNGSLIIYLYNDNCFDKNKFYYGRNSGYNGILIDKNDINIPLRSCRVSFNSNNNNSYDRTVQNFISSVSSSGNFPNDKFFLRVDGDSRYNNDYFYTNFDIIDKNTGDILKTADVGVEQEVEIGDPSSRLKLSYDYNEEYTECHVNATLENGAFTDRIYYSNYMPSIAGQGLLSKQSFPRERYNFKRKSVLILSS